MSHYILITEADREQARQTDLVAFLRQCGETVSPSGAEFGWHYRNQKITIRGNVWYNQYTRVGGDAISFAQEFYDYSYPDAVMLMLEMNCGIAKPSYTTPYLLAMINKRSSAMPISAAQVLWTTARSVLTAAAKKTGF